MKGLIITALTGGCLLSAAALSLQPAAADDADDDGPALGLDPAPGALAIDHEPVHLYDLRGLESLDRRAQGLREAGRHQEAAALYRQALQTLRINRGLYHESQIPLLENLVENATEAGDWAAVDSHYAYMEHLYRRLYPPPDPRLERGLRKIVHWHRTAYDDGLTPLRFRHYYKFHQLQRLRLSIAEHTHPPDHPMLQALREEITTLNGIPATTLTPPLPR